MPLCAAILADPAAGAPDSARQRLSYYQKRPADEISVESFPKVVKICFGDAGRGQLQFILVKVRRSSPLHEGSEVKSVYLVLLYVFHFTAHFFVEISASPEHCYETKKLRWVTVSVFRDPRCILEVSGSVGFLSLGLRLNLKALSPDVGRAAVSIFRRLAK